jgi:hypothetical protein
MCVGVLDPSSGTENNQKILKKYQAALEISPKEKNEWQSSETVGRRNRGPTESRGWGQLGGGEAYDYFMNLYTAIYLYKLIVAGWFFLLFPRIRLCARR